MAERPDAFDGPDRVRNRGQRLSRRGGENGAGWRRITLTDALAVARSDEIDLLVLDEALARLAKLDERAAYVVELRFFAGLTEQAVAKFPGVSERTLRHDWSMARAWLRCELGENNQDKP